MNPELQKSLQVTALSNTLDSYMLVILLIMIAAGILGGLANYFLSDRQGESTRDWARYAILGVIVALTVPLFLNMISSNLLEGARTRPIEFFVFGGFCVLYVVASRRLVENVANKLRYQMDQMKRDVAQVKAEQHEAALSALAAPRDESPAADTPAPAPARAEPVREALAYNDIEIMRALTDENYVYGNLVGITDKTHLAREVVSARLTVLKNLGMIETRINEKNVLHWYVSPKGKQMLDGVLSGQ